MKSHELLRRIIKPYGCKQVAAALKLSLSIIHKWTRARADGRSAELNPLDRIVTLITITGDLRPLHWLCQRFGGFFAKNPALKAWRALTLLKATAVVIGHISQFQTHLAQAERDGRISPDAAEQLRADWEELKSEVESFVGACERGAFRCAALFFPLLGWLVTGDVPEPVLVTV